MRILITEDERIIAEDIKWTLEKAGHEVIQIVATGEDAILIALQEKPDLILMDIVLSGKLDGIETAQRIILHLETPIIFCTANNDSSHLERMSLVKPEGILIKPIEDRELIYALKKVQ